MNATVQAGGWRSEPDFRGTYTILASCLSTLFICTWSALHLDIPEHGRPWYSRFLQKLGWFVAGLLAPEFLLLMAFIQYMAARALTKAMQEKLNAPPEPPSLFVRCYRRFYADARRHILGCKASTYTCE